jgi:hypothetical protein
LKGLIASKAGGRQEQNAGEQQQRAPGDLTQS